MINQTQMHKQRFEIVSSVTMINQTQMHKQRFEIVSSVTS